MKTLLIVLIMTLPASLGAQQMVPLHEIVWQPDGDIGFVHKAMFDDDECGEIIAGLNGKMQAAHYKLPNGAPDSVTFVLSHNVEFEAVSGWSTNNLWTMGKESGGGSGTFTYKYVKDPNRRAYCVGIVVYGTNRAGDFQHGQVCIDGAYAWYSTLSVGLEQAQDEPTQWHNILGEQVFEGTAQELHASGLKGMFISRDKRKYLIR